MSMLKYVARVSFTVIPFGLMMKHILKLSLLLLGLLLVAIAALALTGLAALRQTAPLSAALGTVILLILPMLGLASLFPNRNIGALIASILWPLIVLAGLPLYFPGERTAAVNRGLALLGLPLGAMLSQQDRDSMGRTVDTLLVEPRAIKPPPDADPVPQDRLPPPTRPLESDEIALPYEGRGHTLQVPATIEGPDGRALEVNMIFDTGATYTTLDRGTLHDLGYDLTPDAPRITSQTANGEIQSPLVVVRRLWLGGMEVEGVTVAVCDDCASRDYSGLLGLNVSHRFLVTLDTARQEMLLKPRTDSRSRTLDVSPWLSIEARSMSWSDGRTELLVQGTNQGDRPIDSVEIDVGCEQSGWRVPLKAIQPGATAENRVTLSGRTTCASLKMSLANASW